MGRPKRICQDNLTYHVYSRCANYENKLEAMQAKELFIKAKQKTQKKYKFQLIAYVIMNNHFHMVIRTVKGGTSISRIMQHFKSLLARMMNKLLGRIGPFWNERFNDKIVEQSRNPLLYFIKLLWYLAYNPVRAGLIDDPLAYKYSSINFNLFEDYDPSLNLTHHPLFNSLGLTFKERVKYFLAFGERYREELLHRHVI